MDRDQLATTKILSASRKAIFKTLRGITRKTTVGMKSKAEEGEFENLRTWRTKTAGQRCHADSVFFKEHSGYEHEAQGPKW